MKIIKQVTSAEAMADLGGELARALTSGAIIFLHGQLGAGKTTFTRGFLYGLGYVGKVKSPTYTLVEPYELAAHPVFHFDLYRLNDPDELTFIGIQDYFIPGAVCLIEWPEKGNPLLPQADLACYIEFIDAGRVVTLTAHTAIGEKALQKIK